MKEIKNVGCKKYATHNHQLEIEEIV